MSDSHDEWVLLNIGMEPVGLSRNIILTRWAWAPKTSFDELFAAGCSFGLDRLAASEDRVTEVTRMTTKALSDYLAQLGDA